MTLTERLLLCFNNIGVFINPKDNFLLSEVLEDSLLFVSMIIEMEQEFDIEIPDEYLAADRLTTFQDLEELVKELVPNKS